MHWFDRVCHAHERAIVAVPCRLQGRPAIRTKCNAE
jgi:hypothetical protein